jgi:hypothetical protein
MGSSRAGAVALKTGAIRVPCPELLGPELDDAMSAGKDITALAEGNGGGGDPVRPASLFSGMADVDPGKGGGAKVLGLDVDADRCSMSGATEATASRNERGPCGFDESCTIPRSTLPADATPPGHPTQREPDRSDNPILAIRSFTSPAGRPATPSQRPVLSTQTMALETCQPRLPTPTLTKGKQSSTNWRYAPIEAKA